jgi:hypothetical protein
VPDSPIRLDALQAAVEDANAEIRDYLRSLPGRRIREDGQRAEYRGLVDVYMAAVRARDEARGREAEDEPAAVAA